MQDFEKLGTFYLGKVRRPDTTPADELVLYDARDLTTHAVCVGMTGSGKTGLCVGLIEEAAIDGIPALIIDPKGDLANLMLTFPNLAASDFQPWVDPEEARRRNLSVEDLAQQTAERWKQGLAAWGEDGARIQRLRDAAEFTVYTPGSRAGRPLSILRSFAAPPAAVRDDADLLRERAASTVTSLLGMLQIDADPLRSREHILLASILLAGWEQGRDIDLAGLIQAVQTPPVARVGVMELETFYPAKERFELAMTLNNLLAAPGFQSWLEGDPLDVGTMLYGAGGKPRIAICSIAHLSDAERMFFVSLLLNQTIAWMRAQPGTSSLRAILYMDEIAGYFPPVANPPAKGPLLLLLKQARAFGVGVVLATQNPVDLDYKGLANTGTWFIGKLQTERDRARLLDGLQGAGPGLDRAQIEKLLDGTGNRVFLLHDVHRGAPFLFETRWTLSYLRGPMTRDEIRRLGGGAVATGAATATTMATAAAVAPGKVPGTASAAAASPTASQPMLPPDVPQAVWPVRAPRPEGAQLIYVPLLAAHATVRFSDAKTGTDAARSAMWVVSPPAAASSDPWPDARSVPTTADAPLPNAVAPEAGATFAAIPAAATQAKSYPRWTRQLVDWLFRNESLALQRCVDPKAQSQPGESERDFRIRLADLARQARDRRSAALRTKYAPKLERLQEQVRRAEQAQDREKEQAQQQKVQAAVSVGATVLGAFLGGGRRGSVGRASTAARSLSRTRKEAGDVARAEANFETVQEKLQALNAEFEAEVAALEQSFDAQTVDLETVALRPKKSDVVVRSLQLVWAPVWKDAAGNATPAWE